MSVRGPQAQNPHTENARHADAENILTLIYTWHWVAHGTHQTSTWSRFECDYLSHCDLKVCMYPGVEEIAVRNMQIGSDSLLHFCVCCESPVSQVFLTLLRYLEKSYVNSTMGSILPHHVADRRREFSSLAFFLYNCERQMTQICLLTRAWILRT
jgi:hypothetical protein